MDNLRNIYRTRVAPRVKSWFNPTTVDPMKVRGVLLGSIVTVIIGEVCAYKLITQNIIAGELTILTTDFVIVGISLVEAVIGPFVAWYGYSNRRLLMIGWNIALALVCLLWLAMPAMMERGESEYCHAFNFVFRGITVTTKAAVRLSLLVISCAVFCLTRVAMWSHGIAYLDEYASAGTGMHFGILVLARILPLLAGDKILTSGAEKNLTMQALGLAGSAMGSIVQAFIFMPKTPPTPEEEPLTAFSDRGFFASINRVFQNTTALAQMVAIGLLSAALWGYAFHESEIVKVKYHMDHRDSLVGNVVQVMQYFVIIMSVLYVGVKFSSPILSEFCRYRGIKQAIIMSVITFIFYILLMTVGHCERGRVAGLDNNHYVNPNCSTVCDCIPRWREFEPVCDIGEITTYLSPCQAGCSSSQVVDNIRVYTRCLCARGNGRVSTGACSHDTCFMSYQLHFTFFVMVIMVTVLAFQALGLILLRAVDPRDKSVALGVLCSVVSIITFVCGHLLYLGIRAGSCRWFEAARCHLQSEQFPIYIGSTSATFVVLSIIISVTSLITWKVIERRKARDLATPEERILMDR